MRKNYFESTKRETNLINSTSYINCMRGKPLKNARFTKSTLSVRELTKNVCSEYNANREFQGVFVSGDKMEDAAMEMGNKLNAAGKVESEDVPLEERDVVPQMELEYIINAIERNKGNRRIIRLIYQCIKNLPI